jgi:hypothetical protein
MDLYDFVLLDPQPKSAFQIRIPYADANPDPATKFVLLIRSSILCNKKLKNFTIMLLFKKEQSSENLVLFFDIYG